MSGRLVVCATPIGNLADVSLRLLETLRTADVVACEDTRHTLGLLKRHAITVPLISYHEHNEAQRTPELVDRIAGGAIVALVTDAGMPLVSDPGHVLVGAVVAAGHRVEVLPGPSAVITALVASALPADAWTFVGFLPRRASELRARLAGARETLVAFESPHRTAASLAALAELDPARPVAVCRELTKLHEEVVRGSAAELAARYAGAEPRGEVVLVIGRPPSADADLGAALDALQALVAVGAKARPAAQVVAELTGAPANALYEGLLARKA